jgi:hypothetical protein
MHQIMHQERFLNENFRQFSGYGSNTYTLLNSVRGMITQLEQMTMSNADQAHRLSPTEEESRVTYVQGEYPQNHSIQQAQQRVSGYAQQPDINYAPW